MTGLELIRTAAGLAALGWSGLATAAILRIPGRAAALLSAILLAAGLLVGSAVLLSLLHAFTPAGVMAATGLVTVPATAGWIAAGRPWPFGRPPRRGEILAAARGEPLAAALVAVAVAALLVEGFLAVAVAPNEQDALLYHLPRAAYWVQYHTALQFNPGALGDPEVGNPPNAELMVAWTMVLSHGDRLADLVQWLFAWALALSVYLGARLAGFRRGGAAFAGALVAILPQPIMQASTGQNDLVIASLIAGATVLVLGGLRARSYGQLAAGAIALGLALGTKGTVVYALPGMALLGAGATVAWRPPPRLLAVGVVMLIGSTAALGAFNYVQNLQNTGDITGGMDQAVASDYVRDGPLRDLGRAAWNLLDLPGFGDPRWLHAAATSISGPLFGHLQGSYYDAPTSITTDVSEDESAYGPIGWMVLVPLVLGCLVLPRARRALRLCAAASLSYFAFMALQLGYGPEEARLLMPAVAFAGPLLALLPRSRPLAAAAGVLAIAAMLGTIAYDQNKPLLRSDASSILGRDRLEQQLVDGDFAQKLPALRRLDQLVPGHARLAFLQQDDAIEYLLFGAHLDRYVIPLGDDETTLATLRADHAQGIFIWNAGEWHACRDCVRPAGLRAVRLGAGALLLVPRRGAGRR